MHFSVVYQDEMFTAVCAEIPGLITCANTVERLLLPMIADAVTGWFDTMKKRGLLGEELQRLGVNPHAGAINFAPILSCDAGQISYALEAC